MRTLLALAMLALAGFLIWHGFNTDAAARTEYQGQAKALAPDFSKLHQLYPYSNPAIDAREAALESQVKKQTTGAAGAGASTRVSVDDLKRLGRGIPDRTKAGFSAEMPYVQPDAAAIIGLAGLLLALILPGTRFRGLALLSLIIGAAFTVGGMLPIDKQAGLVQVFSATKHVIFNFPRVAQACLALAAITLGIRVGSAAPK